MIHKVGTTKFTIMDEAHEDMDVIEDWEGEDFQNKYLQFIADFIAKFYEVVT